MQNSSTIPAFHQLVGCADSMKLAVLALLSVTFQRESIFTINHNLQYLLSKIDWFDFQISFSALI